MHGPGLRGAALRWVATAGALLGAAGCGASAASPSPSVHTGTSTGDLAPALSGTTLAGHRVSLAAWHGSPVVVLFWASWCGPCQDEQPALNRLAHAEMPAGVRFIGVSVDVDRSAATSYLQRFGVPYDTILDDGHVNVAHYDVAGPPTAFVLDRHGRVAGQVIGPADASALASLIQAASAP